MLKIVMFLLTVTAGLSFMPLVNAINVDQNVLNNSSVVGEINDTTKKITGEFIDIVGSSISEMILELIRTVMDKVFSVIKGLLSEILV